MPPFQHVIADPAALAELYREPTDLVQQKKRAGIDPGSARFIGLSPFVLIATVGADGGVDVSPRGGAPGFVRVHHADPDHDDGADYILLPDLNGNNLIDTLRAVVATGAAGLLFVVPGKDETLRLNGPAWVVTDAAVLDRFDEVRRPKAAIAVRADEVFVHCAKAFRRGRVWEPDAWAELAAAPDLAELVCESGLVPGGNPELIRADLAEGYARELAEDRPAHA